MNKSETVQVITLLAGNYDSIAKKDKIQKELMVNTWLAFLGDLDYQLVLQAVKKTIIESPYPPTIYDIRKNAIEIVNPTGSNALEDWNECYAMICKGSYMTQEEFDSHSEICKTFLGSLTQLRAYATNVDFNMDIVRSNFLKQHEIMKQREKQQKLLPQKMQDLTKQLANNVKIKELGE